MCIFPQGILSEEQSEKHLLIRYVLAAARQYQAHDKHLINLVLETLVV